MKILIVSDTHRHDENLVRVLNKVGKMDRLIHLGDAEGSEGYICQIANCPVSIVAGNNDFFSDLPKEEELRIGRHRILLTHGHYYYVTVGTQDIKVEAKARGYDIVMFGHTHRPVIDREDNIMAVNPGSLSYPRQEGRKPSFILMEIDDEDEVHFTINYLPH